MGRLNETRNSIGTATFDKGVGRHLDLSTLTGEERLDAAIRTGDIRRRIEEKSQPFLLSLRKKVEGDIATLETTERVQRVAGKVELIRRGIDEGYIPKSELEGAQKFLASLTHPTVASESLPNVAEDLIRIETEDRLPHMMINLSKKEVTIDGRVIRVVGKIDWRVLICLAQNANQEVSLERIKEVARRAGSKMKLRVAGDIIWYLRTKFEQGSTHPEIITRSGTPRKSTYRLNAAVEFITEEKKDKPKKTRQVLLPDGEVVTGLSKREVNLLGVLLSTSIENPTGTSKLISVICGDRPSRSQGDSNQLSFILNNSLRKKLEAVNWTINRATPRGDRLKGHEQKYFLSRL